MSHGAGPNYAALLKDAAVELKSMKARLDDVERSRAEPIAIVGMACRFPGGADNPAAFWNLLESGTCAIREVPPERWNIDEYYHPDPSAPGKMNTRYGGFLDQVDQFDPYFFGISPRECACMDPQQRLFLEVAWEALENAGQPTEALKGTSTGVFVGAFNNDYGHMQLANPARIDIYSSTGTGCAIAGRLSYLLDLRGPCVAVDTACSSSLTAVHLASQSLRLGESDIAIAGGVNLILSPLSTVALSKLQALAADGLCKTFDARADGMARAEGCGVIVLKRLSAARAHGDRILALIRGSAVNQDGRGSSFTSPNALAQREVMRRALRAAGVQPEQVGYIEAHGTGTALGDPIEMDALKDVYGSSCNGHRCAVGSVKTNMGHLEAASGIAGLIKTVLALEQEHIPAHLHFQTLNPHISLDETPFVIPTQGLPWPRGAEPRIAGVSAFGLNGTNAHVLLQEKPGEPVHEASPDATERPRLLPVSARSPSALRELAAQYKTLLDRTDSAVTLEDICYSAGVHRDHHDFRLATIDSSRAGHAAALDGWLKERAHTPAQATARRGGLVFVFAPHGSQWLGMGRRLIGDSEVFRHTIERCDKVIRDLTGSSVMERLQHDTDSRWLDNIDTLQPTLFALQLALAEHWRAWGIEPDAVVGHSMGETAAACFAGGLSIEDAALIACRRSKLLSGVSGQGAMAVVELSLDAARRELHGYEGRLSIAVSNSPRSTVLAGDPAALEEVCDRLQERGIFCGWGIAEVASHSPQMHSLSQTLATDLKTIAPRSPSIPFYSTVTLSAGTQEHFGPGYWVQNLCKPVLFSSAIERLIHDGHRIFLEMSPHPVLLPVIEDWLKQLGQSGHLLPSMRREDNDLGVLLECMGKLYELGVPMDWRKLYPQPARLISLPSYPWQRERFWIDPKPALPARLSPFDHPFLDRHWEAAPVAGQHYWETDFDLARFPYLADHRIQGLCVLPAAAFLELASAAAGQTLRAAPITLEDVRFARPLILPDNKPVTVQVALSFDSDGHGSFQIFSHTAGESKSNWVLHVSGTVSKTVLPPESGFDVEAIRHSSQSVKGSEFYDAVSARGFEFGPCFQGVSEIWRDSGKALVRLAFPASIDSQAGHYGIHPAILDSCLQSIGVAALESDWFTGSHSYLPDRLESFTVFNRPRDSMFAHARLSTESNTESFRGDATLVDANGRIFAQARGLRFMRFDALEPEAFRNWFYQVRWIRQKLPAAAPISAPGSTCLLLCGSDRTGSELRGALEQRGIRCITAHPGTRDLASLLQAPYSAVINLLPLDTHDHADMSVADLQSAQEVGCFAALDLVQALAKAAGRDVPRLWLVTRGSQPVGETSRVSSLSQSGLWGLARTITHEYPELACTRVDLDPEGGAEDIGALAQLIAAPESEDQIAFRSGACYVPRLMRLDASDFELPATPVTLQPDATYLITGGLGGLGFEVAKRMVEHGARQLVLTARSAPTPEKQAVIDEYQANGIDLRAMKADVSDWDDMSRLMNDIDRDMPPLRGIVHSAVVLDDGVLLHQTKQRFRKVFAPKMDGAWILHRLTLRHPLDFFVLFSSGGSLLGSPGDASYAAANAYIDALAHYRQSLGLPALTINWGAWSEVGLGAESAKRGERMAARGASSMTPAQGVEIFGRLLASLVPQIGVMQLNFRQWQEFYSRAAQSPIFTELRSQSMIASLHSQGLRTRLLETPAQERLGPLEAEVRKEICAVLRIAPERVGADTPLGSLGFDSLLAVELRNRLENLLGTTLPVTLVWGFPTLGALSAQLAVRTGLLENGEEPPVPEQPRPDRRMTRLVDSVASLSEESALAELLSTKREAR